MRFLHGLLEGASRYAVLCKFHKINAAVQNRYKDAEDADRWERNMISQDVACIKKWNEEVEMGQRGDTKVDYIPVVLPGGSVSAILSLQMPHELTVNCSRACESKSSC